MMISENILECTDIIKHFPVRGGIWRKGRNRIHVLNGISLTIHKGEIMGLAGESGCGKSTLAKAIVNLSPPSAGQILYNGRRVSLDSAREKKRFYKDVQMIFQDPFASLNPRHKVGGIIGEMLRIHGASPADTENAVLLALKDVGLDSSALDKYPHEFSGGQRQRVAIARALVNHPKLLIADEPVSSLDLATQHRIIELLKSLKSRYDLTVLFISHDLNLIADFCDRTAVMYMGSICELISADQLLTHGRHPYVRALIDSIPISDPRMRMKKRTLVSGEVPIAGDLPTGCAFHPRCPHRFDPCDVHTPRLRSLTADAHQVACHLY
ncbi:MAG: ABC transporter ATP-binding protein [Desulfobacteraceae bacterium]|nr:ABC transporter ATP-binding protein [Desulfobacteraceae bacterium]